MTPLLRAVHRWTDGSPRIWNGLRNDRVGDRDPTAVMADWDAVTPACSDVERAAAIALLESGLEDRPLNALERAHAVLASAGLLDT